jgi:hypothetical protein
MFDSKQFLNDLIKDVNLTDDQKAALQSTLTDPTISKRLEEGQLRQADYSRLSAEAKTKAALADSKTQEALTYYQQLAQWRQEEAARLEAERATNGRGSEGGDPDYLPASFKTQYEKDLQNLQSGAIGLFGSMQKASLDYFKEFGKVLDTDAIIQKATADGTNFNIAYERYILPERQAKSEVELEARIKREREEAAKEALANVSMPTNNATFAIPGGNPHVFDQVAGKAEGQSFGWRAAVAAHTRDAMAGAVKSE